MDSLQATFSLVPATEFESLRSLTLSQLRSGGDSVREDISVLEDLLRDPPVTATSAEISYKILEWDEASQWLVAYSDLLAGGEREVAALQEELREIEGLERGLEQYLSGSLSHDDSAVGGATHAQRHMPLSHDEMAAGDAHEADLERRRIRVQRRLDQLGALPAEEKEHAEDVAFLLAAERRGAEILGPGCQWCDGHFGCDCWARRAEEIDAEVRREKKASRASAAARLARGECACDALTQSPHYENLCDVCQEAEQNRCRECGELSKCKESCCGGCGGCTRCRGDPCKRCGDFESECTCYDDRGEEDYDPSDPYGDGAPEEHNDGPECYW